MKHRSNARAFLVLSALALAAFQACAWKGPNPDIVIAKDASWHERAAAAEIRRDYYLRTGDLPALREVESFSQVMFPAVRTSLEAGEALSLKVIVLSKGKPKSAEFRWREMGTGAFRSVFLDNLARGVYHVTLPAPASDIEYYVEVEADGQLVRFPATAPELVQTVIFLPVTK
jgi:hypothetical protein